MKYVTVDLADGTFMKQNFKDTSLEAVLNQMAENGFRLSHIIYKDVLIFEAEV